MSDETQNTATSDETKNTATEKPEKGRVFTREELGAIVGHETKKVKEENEALKKQLEQFNALSATAAEREKLVADVHAGLLEEIPEDARDLVPSALSKEEQIRYIQKNKARLMNLVTPTQESNGNAQIQKPNNPPEKNKGSQEPNGLPGGWKSVSEFAHKDPKGFLEWDKKNR